MKINELKTNKEKKSVIRDMKTTRRWAALSRPTAAEVAGDIFDCNAVTPNSWNFLSLINRLTL